MVLRMARENPAVVVARIDAERAAMLEDLSDLMTFGLSQPEEIEGVIVDANWPLTVRQAAKFLGKRVSGCRDMSQEIPFKDLMREKLIALRNGERARNLARAVAIRDNPGEGLAADRTVQLKAIGVIEGTEGKAGVVVNVNQQNNTIGAINPGYVIRLPSLSASPVAPAIAHDSAGAITGEPWKEGDTLIIEHSDEPATVEAGE